MKQQHLPFNYEYEQKKTKIIISLDSFNNNNKIRLK